MVWFFFRLKGLFERVRSLESQTQENKVEFSTHCNRTRRAFRRFKREQRKSEKLLKQHDHMLKKLLSEVEQLRESRLAVDSSAVSCFEGSVARKKPVMPQHSTPSALQYSDAAESVFPSGEAFLVIVGSLTTDERKLVETLWREQRPLSYADLRILTGKKTVHAVKKHIHNLQAKGFPLTSVRGANGCKRYYLPKAVDALLEKLIDLRKAKNKKVPRPVKNRGH